MDAVPTDRTGPWLAVADEVRRVMALVDARQFAAVVQEAAAPARRWFFGGQGRSGLVAAMAAMRFMHLGRTCHVIGEASAPAVEAGDGVVLVSGSGATATSVRQGRISREQGAHVVVVTRDPESELARIAHAVLTVPATGSGQLGGNLFEQAALLLLDAVANALADAEAPARLRRRHANLA